MSADLRLVIGAESRDSKKATIVVFETHALTRGCIVHVLRTEFPNLNILEVTSPQCATFMKLHNPSLIILGLECEDFANAEILQNIGALRRRFPETPIALMSDDDE
ncbi:MAG: hypothetical protein ACRCU5_02435, partial [Rhizobiaceae bacterium]